MVFFMHAGFMALSAGAVRTKSVSNICLCIAIDACAAAIAFYLVGWGFAYGEDAGSFIGTSNFALNGVGEEYAYHDWFFQFAFAATAATIVSGAVAERATFESYLTYSLLLSAWVYPVVVHWVWGNGFLTLGGENAILDVGALDFAGDGPVHALGGCAGLIGAYLIGPRIGRFDGEGNPLPMPGHSSPLLALGTFILWVGWFSFNPGSALVLVGNGDLVGRAAVNTLLASATGGLTSLFLTTAVNPGRDWDIGAALNGILGGLVSITASCPAVESWAALVIGIGGGAVYVGASYFVLNVLKVDDPLDASAVHLFTGMYGLLMPGFFAKTEFMREVSGALAELPFERYSGVFYGGDGSLLACQIIEGVVIVLWVTAFIFPYFWVLKRMNLLRISASSEHIGIDHSSHGGAAYPELIPRDLADKGVEKTSDAVNDPVDPRQHDATAEAPVEAAAQSKITQA